MGSVWIAGALAAPSPAPAAPAPPPALRTFDAAALRALPRTASFVLAEFGRSDGDHYATYAGVRIVDLLAAAGVDLAADGVTGVTAIAPDGYARTIRRAAFVAPGPPTVVVRGLDRATLGDCGWVAYPPTIPDPALASAAFAPGGKLVGDGPLRLVVPLDPPHAPMRAASASPSTCADGHDHDPAVATNAQDLVRAVVALRVEPAPAGAVPPDDATLRALLASGGVAVFGAGVEAR